MVSAARSCWLTMFETASVIAVVMPRSGMVLPLRVSVTDCRKSVLDCPSVRPVSQLVLQDNLTGAFARAGEVWRKAS